MGEILSQYFLRLKVKDQIGVLSAVSQICAKYQVSISSVHQSASDGTDAEVLLITHEIAEKNIQAAVEEIKNLDFV